MSVINVATQAKMNEIPCRCGHLESMHGFERNSNFIYDVCYEFVREEVYCECLGYVADNLLYVEQEAAKRGLV